MLNISIDVTDLEGIADDLQFLDAQTLAEIRRDAVQGMALIVRQKSIDQTTRHLNLSRDYVEARIKRDEAGKHPYWQAYLRSEYEGTTLQRFGSGLTQLWKPVNWSNARIQSMGKEFSDWPGWTKRRGDASRGIPADYKSAGVAVAVRRGQNAKRISSAFTMPLRRANSKTGNGIGVFQRGADGELKHLYGPSVYQQFRYYVQNNESTIADGLRDQFLGGMDKAMQRFTK